jgi:hypothetical protein
MREPTNRELGDLLIRVLKNQQELSRLISALDCDAHTTVLDTTALALSAYTHAICEAHCAEPGCTHNWCGIHGRDQ